MRHKEYNPNRILEKSIALFWQNGFNGCSINDLVQATGVNRFSLYHEFENKEGILYASLNLYRERYSSKHLKILQSDKNLVDTLKRFFLSYLDHNEQMMGCYFIHVGTELADKDERVKEALSDYLNEIFELFKSTLVRNNFKNEAELYAKHLVGLFCTVMSFCLIHSPEQREKYIENGINVILSKNGKNA